MDRPFRFPRLLLALLALALSVPAAAAQPAHAGEAALVRDAIDEYQRTGYARVLEVGQTIIVPFGQVDPVLKTALLRTTLIELDRNEYVIDRIVGDSLRWSVNFGVTGHQGNFRQIVSVKPKDQDITTSLVLTTNSGRIYQFTLDSEPYALGGTQNPVDIPYTKHVKFYYPDDAQAAVPAMDSMMMAAASWNTEQPWGSGSEYVDIGQLDASYQIEADDFFPCPPTFAGDDGVRFIVRFPDDRDDPLCSSRFPLYAVGEDGELHLLNYEVFGGNTYIADRIPAEAVILYVNDQRKQRRVRLINRDLVKRMNARRPGFGSDLFVRGGGGVALPLGGDLFGGAYGFGFTAAGAFGTQLSERWSVELYGDYAQLGADDAYLGEAFAATLEPQLEALVEDALAAAYGREFLIGVDVAVDSRPAGGGFSSFSVGAATRYALADRGLFQPYVGARAGVAFRSTSAVRPNPQVNLLGPDGRSLNDAAAQRLASDVVDGVGDQAGNLYSAACDTDPDCTYIRSLLEGRFGSEYALPSGLVGAWESNTALDLALIGGFHFPVSPYVTLSAEALLGFTPLSSVDASVLLPLRLGVQVSL